MRSGHSSIDADLKRLASLVGYRFSLRCCQRSPCSGCYRSRSCRATSAVADVVGFGTRRLRMLLATRHHCSCVPGLAHRQREPVKDGLWGVVTSKESAGHFCGRVARAHVQPATVKVRAPVGFLRVTNTRLIAGTPLTRKGVL
jgi:hypothetical protein